MAIMITSAVIAKAPNPYPAEGFKVFLGGVIDMGEGEPWHETVIKALEGYNIVLVSPKRDDWDASWEQSLENDKFVEQVEWELKAQESADLRLYVFASSSEEAKKSKAPITLMELGLHASDKTVVCCPEGYYRKGNVDVVCRWFEIPVYELLDDLLIDLKTVLDSMGLREKT